MEGKKSHVATTSTVAKESEETSETVYRAYIDAKPVGFGMQHADQLAVITKMWAAEKDPSFMDAAISYCHQWGLPILPELLTFVHEAMLRRIKDGASPNRAFRESQKKRLFEEMGMAMYHGASLRKAAEMAALASHKMAFPFKASTLNREFSKVKNDYISRARALFENVALNEAQRRSYSELWEGLMTRDSPITEQIKGRRR